MKRRSAVAVSVALLLIFGLVSGRAGRRAAAAPTIDQGSAIVQLAAARSSVSAKTRPTKARRSISRRRP